MYNFMHTSDVHTDANANPHLASPITLMQVRDRHAHASTATSPLSQKLEYTYSIIARSRWELSCAVRHVAHHGRLIHALQ